MSLGLQLLQPGFRSGLSLPFVDTFGVNGAFASPWLNTAWAKTGGAGVASVTLGAELVVNGDFSAWSGDNPTGWTVSGESGTDYEVSEVGSGEGHGGTGTGLANLYSSGSAAAITIQQNILTAGRWYIGTLLIDKATTGGIRSYVGGSSAGITMSSTGQKVFVGRPNNAIYQILRHNDNADVTVDNASIKQITP